LAGGPARLAAEKLSARSENTTVAVAPRRFGLRGERSVAVVEVLMGKLEDSSITLSRLAPSNTACSASDRP
jgi:hypothetical protein